MYEWCSLSKWYGYECSDELYDSDGSTIPEMIHFANQKRSPVSSLYGSWSEIMGLVDLECEEDLDEVEPQEKEKPPGKAINEKQGILDSGMESEGEACSGPPLLELAPLQRRRRPTLKVVMILVCLTLWPRSQRTQQRRLVTPHVT